ncbi:MAG: hypothetical protein AAF351_14055 [Pseudomonadota bacterium]
MDVRNIVLLLAVLLIGSCGGREPLSPSNAETHSFDHVKAELRAIVADPVRADLAESQLMFLRQEYDLFGLVVGERRQRGLALGANYDTTREQLDVFMAENLEQMLLSRDRVISAYQALRESLTTDEWAAFGAIESAANSGLFDSPRASDAAGHALADLVAFLFFSSSASGPVDYLAAAAERLDTGVTDEQRRGQASKIFGAARELTNGHNALATALTSELGRQVNRQHDASALQALWLRYSEADVEYSEAILDLRFALRDRLTLAEWQALFGE